MNKRLRWVWDVFRSNREWAEFPLNVFHLDDTRFNNAWLFSRDLTSKGMKALIAKVAETPASERPKLFRLYINSPSFASEAFVELLALCKATNLLLRFHPKNVLDGKLLAEHLSSTAPKSLYRLCFSESRANDGDYGHFLLSIGRAAHSRFVWALPLDQAGKSQHQLVALRTSPSLVEVHFENAFTPSSRPNYDFFRQKLDSLRLNPALKILHFEAPPRRLEYAGLLSAFLKGHHSLERLSLEVQGGSRRWDYLVREMIVENSSLRNIMYNNWVGPRVCREMIHLFSQSKTLEILDLGDFQAQWMFDEEDERLATFELVFFKKDGGSREVLGSLAMGEDQIPSNLGALVIEDSEEGEDTLPQLWVQHLITMFQRPDCEISELCLNQFVDEMSFRQLVEDLQEYKKMKQLAIKTDGMSEEPVMSICPGSKLENVTLEMIGTVVVQTEREMIIRLLHEHPTLKILELNLESNPVDEQSNTSNLDVRRFTDAIVEHPSLKIIDICCDLSGSATKVEIIQPLLSALKQVARPLKLLDLRESYGDYLPLLQELPLSRKAVERIVVPIAHDTMNSVAELDQLYPFVKTHGHIQPKISEDEFSENNSVQDLEVHRHTGMVEVMKRNDLLDSLEVSKPFLTTIPRGLFGPLLGKLGSNNGEGTPVYDVVRSHFAALTETVGLKRNKRVKSIIQKFPDGTRISKEFYDESTGKNRWYIGTVESYGQVNGGRFSYLIRYEDEDAEDMTEQQVQDHLASKRRRSKSKNGSKYKKK